MIQRRAEESSSQLKTASRGIVSARIFTLAGITAILLVALVLSGCASDGAADDVTTERKSGGKILVLAASDLKQAFGEIGKRLEKEEGIKTTFSFGSTGQLAKQVESGGRADVFAAANVKFVDELKSRGLIINDTQGIYAIGRLVIWSRSDAKAHPKSIEDLANPDVIKVAIANPEHAPYGKAAKEAMEKAGVWEKVSKKLVLGENASQTFQFGQSGNVEAAVVPLSLATGSKGEWELVPAELHSPLRQSIAVLKENQNEKSARAFVDFVTSDEGRTILKKYGFELP